MIRPDLDVFDAAARASPAKVSASMAIQQGLRQPSMVGPPPHRRDSFSRDGTLSTSCPRTPNSHKKRKDSGSNAPINSAAFQKNLERKLVEADHLLFQYKPATYNNQPTYIFPPSPSQYASHPSMIEPSSGSTITLGSTLGVSHLLLSASSSKEFLFSPGVSPQPSPAMHAFNSTPKSPVSNHAISFLTNPNASNSGSGMSLSTMPAISLDGLSSSPPHSPTQELEGASQSKKQLTAQQWNAQHPSSSPQSSLVVPSVFQSAMTSRSLSPPHGGSNPAASFPTSSRSPRSSGIMPFGHRRGSGNHPIRGGGGSADSLNLGSELSSAASSGHTSLGGSGMTSANESERGSFSGAATGVPLVPTSALASLLGNSASSMDVSQASHFGFTLGTRRRNNSGPPSVIRQNSESARNLPEPGAPIAAVHVLGGRSAATAINNVNNSNAMNEDDSSLHPISAPLQGHSMVSSPNFMPQNSPVAHSFHPTPPSNSGMHTLSLPSPQSHIPSLPSALPMPPLLSHAFDWDQKIGQGSFGEVWRVIRKEGSLDTNAPASPTTTPALFAIKRHFHPLQAIGERRLFLRRIELMKVICDSYNNRSSNPRESHSPGVSYRYHSPAPEHTANSSEGSSAAVSNVPSACPSPALHSFPGHSTMHIANSLIPYRWPPHLLKHFAVWQENSLLYTLTEYCPEGDLFQFFRYTARVTAQNAERVAALHRQSSSNSSATDGEEDESMGIETTPQNGTAMIRVSSTTSLSSIPALINTIEPETKDISEEDLLHIIHQISSILAILHKQNILHGDCKPDNIYVCKRQQYTENPSVVPATADDEEVPVDSSYPYIYKLGDLGSIASISEWVDGDSEGDGSYLAPEVLNPSFSNNGGQPAGGGGRMGHITQKIDIFSFGVTLFALITGQKFSSSVLQHDLAMANAGVQIASHEYTPPPAAIVLTVASPTTAQSAASMVPSSGSSAATALASSLISLHQPIPVTAHSRFARPTALGGIFAGGLTSAATTATDSMMSDSDAPELHTPTNTHSAHVGGLYTRPGRLEPLSNAPSSRLGFPISASHDSLASMRPNFSTSPPPFPFSQPSPPPISNNNDNVVEFNSAKDVVSISSEMQQLVRRMLSVHPWIRPSSDELREWACKEIGKRK